MELPNDRLFTAEQLAKAWRCSERSIRRYIEAGELAAIKVAERYLVSQSAAEEFMRRAAVRIEGATMQAPDASTMSVLGPRRHR